MKRPRKVFLGIIAGLFGLIIVLVLGLLLFFPVGRARDIAVRKIEAATGREVSIESAALRFLPRVHLALGRVSFGEAASPGAPQVTLESLELELRPLPLIARRMEVTSVVLTRPEVKIVLAEDPTRKTAPSEAGPTAAPAVAADSAALAPAAGAPAARARDPRAAPATEPPKIAAGGFDVRVERFEINGGRVDVRLPTGQRLVELAGISERLSAEVRSGGALDLAGRTEVDSIRLYLPSAELGRGLRIGLEKRLHFDPTEDVLAIERAELDLAGLPIAAAGTVSGLNAKAPVADLTLRGGPAEVANILGLLPSGMFPEVEGVSSGGVLLVEGSVKGPLNTPTGPAFDLGLTLDQGRIQYPDLDHPIDAITLRLRATPDVVEVTQFGARAGDSHLTARATISSYRTDPALQVAIDADVDLADVPRTALAGDSLRVGGRARAMVVVEGRAARPDEITASGTVALAGVSAESPLLPAPLTDVTGDVVFDRQAVTIERLAGRVGESDFRVKGTLKNPLALDPRAPPGGERARATLDLASDRLNLDALLPPVAAPAGSASKAPGSPAPAAPTLPPLPPLDGQVALQVGQLTMNGVTATDLRGRLVAENAKVTLDGVSLRAFGGEIGVTGALDLADPKAIDFGVGLDVRGTRASQLLGYARGFDRLGFLRDHLDGLFSLQAEMTGSLGETMNVDLASVASKGRMQMAEAHLAGHPLQARLSEFLSQPEVADVAIRDWVQAFRIEGSRLEIDGLNLKAGEMELMASGWQSLDGKLELKVDLWLPPSLTKGVREKLPSDLAALLLGEPGERVLVPITASGSSREPNLSIDTARLMEAGKGRAAARLEAERKRLAEDAARAAQGALKGLVGAKEDTAAVEAVVKEKVEEEVKDRLKQLLGGKKSR